MKFGDILKSMREEAGLTQTALAAKAGLSLRTIQGWEQGRRSPVSPDFFRLTRAMGTSCESFSAMIDPSSKNSERKARKAKKK
jgi:transcriptional regulator with XRE-family HTH domain